MTYAGAADDPGRRQPRDGARRLPRRLHRGAMRTRCAAPAWRRSSWCSTAAVNGAERRAHRPRGRGRRRGAPPARQGVGRDGRVRPEERSRVLDLLGFEGQLVFATFATSMFTGSDLDRLYAGSAAQNRAVADFCAHDPRLLPVAYVPLVDTERATAAIVEAIGPAAGPSWSRARRRGDRAPTHPDLDACGTAGRGGRPVRPARRRRREAARPGVPQQRHAGHRPPGRRREHPLQGLPRHPRLAGAVPRGADLRRAVRSVPQAAGRVHRAGRRLGRLVDAPPRLRPARLPPDRGAARRSSPQAERVRPRHLSSCRSPASRSAG